MNPSGPECVESIMMLFESPPWSCLFMWTLPALGVVTVGLIIRIARRRKTGSAPSLSIDLLRVMVFAAPMLGALVAIPHLQASFTTLAHSTE